MLSNLLASSLNVPLLYFHVSNKSTLTKDKIVYETPWSFQAEPYFNFLASTRSPDRKITTPDALMSYKNDLNCTGVYGLRAEGDRVYITEEGITRVPASSNFTLRIFGRLFSNSTQLAFTGSSSVCDKVTKIIHITNENILSENALEIVISLPLLEEFDIYYMCVKRICKEKDEKKSQRNGYIKEVKLG
ncbi:metal transporter CNNM2 [Caerostris extrusa]|uniref:Metal transporter CNNM2 n=1 Tax=Caerostris extrusa TaxID=172846 RepID=A0AAV4MQC8_CAEEX|nr:metal transporter CNNM2 [Caerostris extrusa]